MFPLDDVIMHGNNPGRSSEKPSPVTGEFPAQRASNAENFSIWWRHHEEITLDQ